MGAEYVGVGGRSPHEVIFVKTSFGKYTLIERIGTGGMAEVFLAKSQGAEGLEKFLVIKRILPELAENNRFVEMFIGEARIAVALNHPNIVQIYDFGKVDGDFFLAMEFVDGWDLGDLLKASIGFERLPLGDAVFIALEVARGLDYAHRRRDEYGNPLELVHRDISPQNLLVSRDGTIKIVDFGIAKAANLEEENPHVVKGKFCYMSPEQASGEPVDHRSDLFSLGVVFFELVCNRPLFKQGTKEQTLSLVRSAVVPDIASLVEDIPEQLEAVLYKLLAREPEERFQTARELQSELTRVLYGMEDIHDSYTLSEYLAGAESWLDGKASGLDARESGHTDTIRTNIIRTAARTATTAERGNTIEMAMSRTPLTPVIDGTDPGMEIAATPEIQARSRKEAVIIAGELDGLLQLRSDIGQERWLQVFQEYTRMVDSIAFKCDGVVHRVNESGFVLLLGVPVSSENDAERAARVAMDLQDAMAGINLSLDTPLQLAIGVAITDVILDQEQDRKGRRFTWSFFGDSHEFAEELARVGMAKEILLGGQVWRRIKRDYDCERIDQITTSNLPPDTQAWRLVKLKTPKERIKEVRRGYHVFHGRELELRTIRQEYRRALMEGSATCMLLVGEQGVGKSTLLEEFLGGLDPRNVRVVRGAANPFELDVPLGGLGALLAELLRLGSHEDLRQVRSTLETRIAALFPDERRSEQEILLHSIGAIFGIRFPGGVFDDLGGEERRKRISMSLRKLFTRFAAKKPFVLSIDDAQYIDPMTLEIAAQIFDSRQDSPMFLLLVLTESGMEANAQKWERLEGARYVQVERLGELGDGAAGQIVRDLLRVHRIDDEELVEEILRRSGGNPFYIKEVFEVLRDRGLLKDAGERRQLKLDLEHATWLPTSVEGAITARIDRLDLASRSLLQKIAFLWNPFKGDEVRIVTDEEPWELMETLIAHRFLEVFDEPRGLHEDTFEPSATPPEQRTYRFLNALTKEIVSRTLLEEEATVVHDRIAERLLQNFPAVASVTEHAQIARHLDGAGRLDEAVEHYHAAAEGAFEQFGAAEALRLSDRVLERTSPESDMGFEALRLREQALRELGVKIEHREALELLAEQVEQRGDPKERAEIYLRLARYHYDQAEFKTAMEYIAQVRELATAHDLPASHAQSLHYEAYINLDQGHREDALELIREAIVLFEAAEDEDVSRRGLSSCYNTRGIIMRRAGRHQDALASYQRALDLLSGYPNERLGRYLLINMGLALVYVGRFDDGIECYQRALAQAKQLGHRRDEAGVLINMGHAYQVLGEYDRAISHIQRGLYLARKASANYTLADGEITLGVCYAERGELEKAERVLSEGSRLAESIPHIYLAVHAMLALAKLKLETGQVQDARVAIMQAEDSLERCEDAGMRWGVLSARLVLARAYKILGMTEKQTESVLAAAQLIEDGEEYGREEAYYYISQLLPETSEYLEQRREAIEQARALIMRNADGISDESQRQSFLSRDLHQKILSATGHMQ